MKLVIIFGPPAVGKTTVGKALEERSNLKLFHNHMVMDGVMHIFGVGTPAEDKLSKNIRKSIIQEAAEQNIDLIFTYVWNFSKEKGKNNIDTYKEIYESQGGEVFFIELTAPLEIRAQRADMPDRKKEKAHAPDKERVLYLEEQYNFQAPEPFFYDNYKKINTENKTPEEIAEEIIAYLE
jgi:adenylate kinase family enzyme